MIMKRNREHFRTMDDPADIPFFFIIGRPRTGTTLLRSLFDAHPNVQIPWECQFMLNLYPRYGSIRNWTGDMIDRFYSDLLTQWQFNAWNIDHDRLKANLRKCIGPNSYTFVCRLVYMNFISFYPKETIRIIGDKNHGYTLYADRLKKLFPDSKFIYILRDYRDNYHSVRNVDFELPVVSLVVYKWKFFYRKALQAARKHPDSFYFIRYEDLVTDPAQHLQNLCTFLEIPYDPEVLDFWQKKDEAMKKYPAGILQKHHRSLFNPVNTSRIGLWEKSMPPRQVRIADHVAGRYAALAGYTRRYRAFNPWIALMAMPGILYARLLYCLTWFIDLFPYRTRERILSKGPLWIARTFRGLFRRS